MDTFETPGRTRVVVFNPIDGVELTTNGGATTSVELVPRGAEAEAFTEEATVSCTEVDGVHVVTVTLPNPRSFAKRRNGLDVRISAPEDVDVVIASNGAERSLLSLARGFSGNIRLQGRVASVDVAIPGGDLVAQIVNGSLSVKTASGDVSVDRVAGSTKIRTVSGDVEIDEVLGEALVTVVSGDVTIGNAEKELDVTSVSGDIDVTDARAGASCKSTSGDVTIRRVWSGTVRAGTVSGDIVVGVPPGRGVTVDARSMAGDLRSEIDLSEDRPRGEEPAGDGDDAGGVLVAINANSVSGDVQILRAAGAAA